jgi:thermopsin
MDDTKYEFIMLFGWVFAVTVIAVAMLYPYETYQLTNIGISNGVNLYSCKYAEPAPMGVVDYGVSSYGNVYNISTDSVQASITDNNILTNMTGNYNASIQLNSNLFFKYGNKSQAYYLQNVILINSKTKTINIIDNIWNNSGIDANIHSSNIRGMGTVAPSIKNSSYYFYEAANQTGDNITLNNGQEIYLRTNSTVSITGKPEIIFSYNDGYGWIKYDIVEFNTTKKVSNVSILISGFNYTPSFNFYDAGIIIGGPGTGSNTTLVSGSMTLSLEYWNGENFQNIQDAYDFGCNTEEGIKYAVVNAEFSKGGLPFANITSGKNAYLGYLWSINSSNIGLLYINSTVKNLYISMYKHSYMNESLPNGKGEFTLESGSYIIKAYENSSEIYDKNYSLLSGTANYVNIN